MNNTEELTMFNHPFKWFRQQISGWPVANYCLFWFAVGAQLMLLVTGKVTSLAVVTFIGTVVGVLCIVSINAAKSVNGILGVISAICLIYVGIKAKNYLSCFEQVAYMLTLDFPVIFAIKSWNEHTVEHLRKLTGKGWTIAIISTLLVWIISSYAIGHLTNDPRPWIDGMSFAISLTAGIMCFLRYNNQYYWWSFSDVSNIILWAITFMQGGATLAMLVSNLIYAANDVLAFATSPWFKRGRKKAGLSEIALERTE